MNIKNENYKRDFIVNTLIFISFFVLTSILQYLFIRVFNIKEPYTLTDNILVSIPSMAIYLFILIFIYRKDLKKDIIDFKKNFSSYILFGLNIWLIGVLVMIVSNVIISNFLPTSSNEQTVQSVIKLAPFYSLLSTIIYAPITEELIFRKTLKNIFKNNIFFIIISGLIFGLIHTIFAASNNILEFLFIIPYGILGSCFAYMYAKKKNILLPIFFHAFHNAILVIFSIIVNLI